MGHTKTYIVGNWKMHGDAASARTLVEAVVVQASKMPASVEVVVCPPATLARDVASQVAGSRVRVGGQDCHDQADGAFTGDVSAAMLKDVGCGYVIIGHSERRSLHKETSELVRKKALRAIKTRLIPIICIGETRDERVAGKAYEVVGGQLWDSIPEETQEADFILAYEPVWAIGSGLTATTDDIRDMHTYILGEAAKKTGLATGSIPVLYGGSVKAAGAREILTTDGVSGVLVGGASLKAEEFCNIVASAAS